MSPKRISLFNTWSKRYRSTQHVANTYCLFLSDTISNDASANMADAFLYDAVANIQDAIFYDAVANIADAISDDDVAYPHVAISYVTAVAKHVTNAAPPHHLHVFFSSPPLAPPPQTGARDPYALFTPPAPFS